MEGSADESESVVEVEVQNKLEEYLKLNEVNTGEEDMTETDSSIVVKRWLSWCRSQSLVKCAETDVPSSILPKNYRGILIDVKVGGKKRGPDDKIYLAHKELRDKVARGNCVLELSKIEKGKIASTKYIFLVFALRKFSGGMGDEDDSTCSVSQWQKYFIKPIESAKLIIGTEKANGEAAHVSALKLFGRSYLCCGSKNVHLLIRNKDDISKYTESRFEFARRIARSFYDTYLDNTEISEEKKQSLLSFLQTNKYTGVAEMIQPHYQHVVNLSYLERPVLKFICWTKPDISGNFSGNDSYCALPVNECLDRAKEFGLETVDYEYVNLPDGQTLDESVEEYMEKIRNEHGHEGKVIYFLDKDNMTIGLIKKKTAWYVILRAIREKIALFSSSKKSYSGSERSSMVTKRIKNIQSWLEFSDGYADSWIRIAISFVQWTQSRKGIEDARAEFPILFEKFLRADAKAKKELDSILACADMKTLKT